MTFRPSLAARWMYPALIAPCVALLWWIAAASGYRLSSKSDPLALAGGLMLAAALLLAVKSWQVWTTRVSLSEKRIEWKRGIEYGSLACGDVAKLGVWRGRGSARLGLVERNTELLHRLPLLTRDLYEALRERFGGLPPDVEADLFGR